MWPQARKDSPNGGNDCDSGDCGGGDDGGLALVGEVRCLLSGLDVAVSLHPLGPRSEHGFEFSEPVVQTKERRSETEREKREEREAEKKML